MRALRYIFRLCPIIPAIILATLIAFTLIPEQLAPRPPTAPYPPACDILERHRAPSAENLLGTDYLGCDILSMMIYETRAMIIPLVISLTIGALVELYAGLIGGYFEAFIPKAILKLNNLWLVGSVFLTLLVISALNSVLSAAIGIVFALFAAIGIAFILLATIATLFLALLLGIAPTRKIPRTRAYIHRARRQGIPTSYIIFKRVVPRTSRVILTVGVTSGLFIIDPWVRTFLALDYVPQWYTDTSDWFVITSPITIIVMGLWVISPIGTLILLAGWLQNRLPRF